MVMRQCKISRRWSFTTSWAEPELSGDSVHPTLLILSLLHLDLGRLQEAQEFLLGTEMYLLLFLLPFGLVQVK